MDRYTLQLVRCELYELDVFVRVETSDRRVSAWRFERSSIRRPATGVDTSTSALLIGDVARSDYKPSRTSGRFSHIWTLAN